MTEPHVQTRPRFETQPETESCLRCARCDHEVTRDSARVGVAGQHVHTRINPGGWVHQFGCFAQADGVRVTGPSTTEHTWFAGYAWALVVCASCGEHLGWRFSGETLFYGLLLDRLRGA